MNQWEAFDAVEPIGEQWHQTAQLCGMVQQMVAMQLATAGVKSETYETEDFYPPRYRPVLKPKVKAKIQKPKDTFNALSAMFGLGK